MIVTNSTRTIITHGKHNVNKRSSLYDRQNRRMLCKCTLRFTVFPDERSTPGYGGMRLQAWSMQSGKAARAKTRGKRRNRARSRVARSFVRPFAGARESGRIYKHTHTWWLYTQRGYTSGCRAADNPLVAMTAAARTAAQSSSARATFRVYGDDDGDVARARGCGLYAAIWTPHRRHTLARARVLSSIRATKNGRRERRKRRRRRGRE